MSSLIFNNLVIKNYLIAAQLSQLVKDKAHLENQVIELLAKIHKLELENILLKTKENT